MATVQELEKPVSIITPAKLESPDDAGKLIEQQDALKGVLEPTVSQPPAVIVNDDDVTGQPLLTPSGAQVPEITLPETEDQAREDLKTGTDNARHWFGAWVLRMVGMAKRIGAKIVYRQSK